MVIHACSQRSSPVKNRMREICTSGSVGGEGGNILAYPAAGLACRETRLSLPLKPGYGLTPSGCIGRATALTPVFHVGYHHARRCPPFEPLRKSAVATRYGRLDILHKNVGIGWPVNRLRISTAP